mmetsp:Transcript_30414/g.48812  ORF Transcript_30414/g.48812 Transcript_30414/m.48812 type:complete len:97 (-) Transcript_30414:424-714(-)
MHRRIIDAMFIGEGGGGGVVSSCHYYYYYYYYYYDCYYFAHNPLVRSNLAASIATDGLVKARTALPSPNVKTDDFVSKCFKYDLKSGAVILAASNP